MAQGLTTVHARDREATTPERVGEVTVVEASTPTEWRTWLEENGRSVTEVWLVLHHRDSGTPGVRYPEAVEQALCFGWVDGLHRSATPAARSSASRPVGPAARGAG